MESTYNRKCKELFTFRNIYKELSLYFDKKELNFLLKRIYKIDSELKEIDKSIGTISDGGKGSYKAVLWNHGQNIRIYSKVSQFTRCLMKYLKIIVSKKK